MIYDLKSINGIPVDFSFVKNIYKKKAIFDNNLSNKSLLNKSNNKKCIKNHIIIEPPNYLIDHHINASFELDKNIKKLIITFLREIITKAYSIVEKRRNSTPSVYNSEFNDKDNKIMNNATFIKLVFSMMYNGIDNIIIEPTIDTQLSIHCNSEYLLESMLCYISTFFPNITIYYHPSTIYYKNHKPKYNQIDYNYKIINQKIILHKNKANSQLNDTTNHVQVSINELLMSIQKFNNLLQ